jgi:hypothetical protein
VAKVAYTHAYLLDTLARSWHIVLGAKTREGPAISFARAALFLTVLSLFPSAAVAHARPSFTLTETSAHAGGVVHFSITGLSGNVAFEFEVGDEQVVDGTANGDVSGAFTVPDLGDEEKTVTVEAEIKAAGKKKFKRKLEYLGPSQPVEDPPRESPAPVQAPALTPPDVAPQAAPSPGPSSGSIHLPGATGGTSPPLAVAPRSGGRPHKSGRRHEHAQEVARSDRRRSKGRSDRGHHTGGTRGRRSRHLLPRTAPLFDGVPEPGYGDDQGGDSKSPHKDLTATSAHPGDGFGLNAAILVPALLIVTGLVLVVAALLRRRRLSSGYR